jgi:hypothetical protein
MVYKVLCSAVIDVCLHWVLFCIPGAEERVQFCSLIGTPVPKELSKSSDNVIVERLPNMVRKVTVLKCLPERHPILPPRERNIVVKSVKLPTEFYPGPSSLLSNKHIKEHTLKTDSMYSIFSCSHFKCFDFQIWDIHVSEHILRCNAMLVNGYQHIRGPCNIQLPKNFGTHLSNCMLSDSKKTALCTF